MEHARPGHSVVGRSGIHVQKHVITRAIIHVMTPVMTHVMIQTIVDTVVQIVQVAQPKTNENPKPIGVAV